jgi:exodeoxyribonuclease V alpha subunit
MIETITGKLKKVIYRSLDTSFMIGAFIDPHSKKQFTATGEIHKPIEELQYSLEGKWIENPQYGMQFQVSSYSVEEPCDSNSIAVYLEKHVNGIGPVLADMLIEKYRCFDKT